MGFLSALLTTCSGRYVVNPPSHSRSHRRRAALPHIASDSAQVSCCSPCDDEASKPQRVRLPTGASSRDELTAGPKPPRFRLRRGVAARTIRDPPSGMTLAKGKMRPPHIFPIGQISLSVPPAELPCCLRQADNEMGLSKTSQNKDFFDDP